MEIVLYKLSKRRNSTKRPSNSGATVSAKLKSGDNSILSPLFVLSTVGDFTEYNYCYVSVWNRYYFISDWNVNITGIYTFSCTVDALASWKDDIINHSLYAVRSSAAFDGYIPDTAYPFTECVNTEISGDVSNPWPLAGSAGSYIIGVLGGGNSPGVTYYALDALSMGTLMSALMSTVDYLGISDISEGLQKSLINPMQYIDTVYYLPIDYITIIGLGITQKISVGWWNFDVDGVRLGITTKYTADVNFSVPEHEQVTRGKYLNRSPYSRYNLYAPPFGMIPVDSTYLSEAGTLTAHVIVSPVPGRAVLKIKKDDVLVDVINANVAIPVTVGSLTQDISGFFNSAISGGVHTGTAIASGNVFGAISGLVSTIGDMAQAISPKVQSMGGTPDFSQVTQAWKMLIQRFKIADEDNAELGRPLCKNVVLSQTGTGFYVVRDGDIPTKATPTEKASIYNHLTGGFFYE